MPILDAAVAPRIWLGNRVTVPAHFDESYNLACVVAGRRRFTLFPPEQVGNLYIGPLDFAPTGAAMSVVNLAEPDLRKVSEVTDALAAALTAELAPGDAIFIPTLWWHHVESLDRELNVLVNYWWNGALRRRFEEDRIGRGLPAAQPAEHRPLPPELRQAWARCSITTSSTRAMSVCHTFPRTGAACSGPRRPEASASASASCSSRSCSAT